MKHFVIQTTFNVPFEQLGDALTEHRAFLQHGYDRGWILCSGPQNPRVGGIIVVRGPSLADLQAFFAEDPYQKKGLAQYRFIEFEPVKRQAFLEEWVTGA